MQSIVVVTREGDWPLELDGIRLVTAREYLTSREFSELRQAKVYNLCRHYRYQAFGYYVSLLAEARGHKPLPTVLTMQDLRSPALVRIASYELEDQLHKSLAAVTEQRFVLHVYFGRCPDRRFERLSGALFRLFTAPFLRASFVHGERWELHHVSAIPTSAVPAEDKAFALESAQSFFTRPPRTSRPPRPSRFDLAILYDPSDPVKPSDLRAIEKFVAAAEALDIEAEVIGREDAGRLLEFDALFIRSTTSVNHFTYRFARRAEAEGLVVIDDPLSILRCTNKVYLAELMGRHGVPTPRTVIVHREDRERLAELGLPCVVKQPDSSSSLGVFKAETREELEGRLDQLFEISDLVIGQEFVPTAFDWRIGVLDRRPLFAVRYYMAPRHWQVIRHDSNSARGRYGRWDVVPVDEVPAAGLAVAVKAAGLIGDGLYGVDLKQLGDRWVLIEVNDNPNVETTVEDGVAKDGLYLEVMRSFVRRLEAVTERRTGREPRQTP